MNSSVYERLDDVWYKHVAKELDEAIPSILARHKFDPVFHFNCFRGLWKLD